MRHFNLRMTFLLILLGIPSFFGIQPSATASPTAASPAAASPAAAKKSLTELQQWLSGQRFEAGWTNYLKLADLEKQIALGDKADKASVKKILKLFQSDANGLQMKRFVAVRGSLQQWHNVLARPKVIDLAGASGNAKSDIQVPSKQDAKTALENLNLAMTLLEPLLDNSSVEKETWREYLQWKDLKEVLGREKVELAVLNQFIVLMAEDEVGFEEPRFIKVRHRLKDYVNTVSLANNAKAKAIVQQQLDTLAGELKRYHQTHQGVDARIIGRRLGFLTQAKQVPSFVSAVRHHYCKPNLFLNVNHRFLSAAMYRKIDDRAPVQQFILGTDISGTGHTLGEVDLQLIPNTNRAVFLATMKGTTHSDTIGYNGPVTIYSSSVAKLSATKRIEFDQRGLWVYNTNAHVTVNTTINSIEARRRFIEKMAWKQAGKKKACAEGIAAGLAEERVIARFDKESGPKLYDANQRYLKNMKAPLLRRDGFPRLFRFATTENNLTLTAMQAGDDQLGAPDGPSAVTVKSDIAVQIHESWVNNLASVVLAGQTLTEKGVQDFFIERLGEVPEQLKSKKDQDPWAITFAKKDPILLVFDDSTFSVTIRGQKYQSGERSFGRMNVTATYKINKNDLGIKLTRQGELVILPPNFKKGDKLSTEQINLRTILKKRLGNVFKTEIVPKNVDLTAKFEYIDELILNNLASKKGWLSMGYNAVINK